MMIINKLFVPFWCLYFIYVEYKTDFKKKKEKKGTCPAEPVKL